MSATSRALLAAALVTFAATATVDSFAASGAEETTDPFIAAFERVDQVQAEVDARVAGCYASFDPLTVNDEVREYLLILRNEVERAASIAATKMQTRAALGIALDQEAQATADALTERHRWVLRFEDARTQVRAAWAVWQHFDYDDERRRIVDTRPDFAALIASAPDSVLRAKVFAEQRRARLVFGLHDAQEHYENDMIDGNPPAVDFDFLAGLRERTAQTRECGSDDPRNLQVRAAMRWNDVLLEMLRGFGGERPTGEERRRMYPLLFHQLEQALHLRWAHLVRGQQPGADQLLADVQRAANQMETQEFYALGRNEIARFPLLAAHIEGVLPDPPASWNDPTVLAP